MVLDGDTDVDELADNDEIVLASGLYQLDEVPNRPMRISAQYMHGCECSANENRKSTRNNGDVFGNGSRKSGIHHRRQYILLSESQVLPLAGSCLSC